MWRLGNGTQIRDGEDLIIGSATYYKLSIPLLIFLHENGIVFLTQISKLQGPNDMTQSWMFEADLGLLEDL